ncbi:Crp/Fnr family transcriptional regulator [Rhizobium lemnae]|uniref:Crp/Fnr family transcriptional regulator n=1 Tax=Rhizobium lemnae TaxID=1214924 RepID=A0ABV8E8G7_9HYPH|nr:Crp/Fnr family transcriptional regulator [Rhizobium lemnae]MCJ8507001.1 Crp/Fnr family transcriptional regulator [Rhizobium lemnae]
MLQLEPELSRNLVLSRIPARDLDGLLKDLELIDLPHGEKVAVVNEPTDYVYFPVSGIGSVVVVSPTGKRVEAGLIGREGFFPTWVMGGVKKNIHEITVQVQGRSWRLDLNSFERAICKSEVLNKLLHASTIGFQFQVSATALSNAIHSVEERLTQWLLMCHDRIDGDELALTHEFIAIMLAVRRPSVTTSLHMLEGRGFIRSERGLITIRDRSAMEKFATDAYGMAERHSQQLEQSAHAKTIRDLMPG